MKENNEREDITCLVETHNEEREHGDIDGLAHYEMFLMKED
ncbi:MAG TPA: hypothetical protein VK250_00865 [Nitrososphaeraceae archaeon]|nr:hypothetical protein [Nitrososphaeraceae archaeon]